MKTITKVSLAVLGTSIALLAILPGNPPDSASAAQSAAQHQALADAPAQPSPAPAAAHAQPESAPALASETLEFLDGAAVDLRAGLEARDAAGIRDAIEWPAIRLEGRWQELPAEQRVQHLACFDALDAMRVLAGDLTSGRDSLERRKSIDRGANVIDASLAQCRHSVTQKGAQAAAGV